MYQLRDPESFPGSLEPLPTPKVTIFLPLSHYSVQALPPVRVPRGLVSAQTRLVPCVNAASREGGALALPDTPLRSRPSELKLPQGVMGGGQIIVNAAL